MTHKVEKMPKKIFMLALLSTGFVMILFSRLTLIQKGFGHDELSDKDLLKKTLKEPWKEKLKEMFKETVKKTYKETSKEPLGQDLSAETAIAAVESSDAGTHVVLYYTSWWPDHGSESCICTVYLC